MRTLINILADIVRGSKYRNTYEYKEKGINQPKYTVEEDEYGYKHYKKDGLTHKLSGPESSIDQVPLNTSLKG